MARARLLHVGALNAPASAIPLLGVRALEPWSIVGRNFAIIATVVTTVVVTLRLSANREGVLAQLPLALLFALPFAAVNAAVEEGLVRLALIEGTIDVIGPSRACRPARPVC